jgi:hypothetical protein
MLLKPAAIRQCALRIKGIKGGKDRLFYSALQRRLVERREFLS